MNFLKKLSIKKLIVNNFWLKVISLIIAIIIWLLASGLIVEIPKGIKV